MKVIVEKDGIYLTPLLKAAAAKKDDVIEVSEGYGKRMVADGFFKPYKAAVTTAKPKTTKRPARRRTKK